MFETTHQNPMKSGSKFKRICNKLDHLALTLTNKWRTQNRSKTLFVHHIFLLWYSERITITYILKMKKKNQNWILTPTLINFKNLRTPKKIRVVAMERELLPFPFFYAFQSNKIIHMNERNEKAWDTSITWYELTIINQTKIAPSSYFPPPGFRFASTEAGCLPCLCNGEWFPFETFLLGGWGIRLLYEH